MPRNDYGFARTSCDCEACKTFCKHMSGMLAPPDLDRLKVRLGCGDVISLGNQYLSASPGAILMDEVGIFRVGTLVPRRHPNGSCVFFKDGLCKIYEDAPYGCSHMDSHMSEKEGQQRSLAALRRIEADNKIAGPYTMVHGLLTLKGIVAEPPEVVRQNIAQETGHGNRPGKRIQRAASLGGQVPQGSQLRQGGRTPSKRRPRKRRRR